MPGRFIYIVKEWFSDTLRMENDDPVQCVVVLAAKDEIALG